MLIHSSGHYILLPDIIFIFISFVQLSGEVRRRIGLKVLELGGNAVIGYKQYFDLEGESGIVVRVSMEHLVIILPDPNSTKKKLTVFNKFSNV